MTGLAEPRQHEDLAARNLRVERFGSRQAVHSRQVDVEHGHIGPGLDGGLKDLITPVEFRDNLHIRLSGEQSKQRSSDEVHILGDENAYHPNASGTSTVSR